MGIVKKIVTRDLQRAVRTIEHRFNRTVKSGTIRGEFSQDGKFSGC